MARRIKAALAYGRISRKRAAAILHVSVGHLDHYTARGATHKPDIQLLQDLAAEADIGPNWFTADLSRLPAIVTEGVPTLATVPRPSESLADVADSEARRPEDTPPAPARGRPGRRGKGRAA